MKRLRRLEVKSAYDFYEAPEETRLSLVGEFYLVEKDEPKDPVDRYPEWMYFPIQLTEEGSYYNYGVRQALISVLQDIKDKFGGERTS